MNKLTNLFGIGALSLVSLVSGCKNDEVKTEGTNNRSYSVLLARMDDDGNLIKTDTLVYPLVFKGTMVFDKNDITGPYILQGYVFDKNDITDPYILQGYFHFGADDKIIYHPDKKL